MSKRKRPQPAEKRSQSVPSPIALWLQDSDICVSGYTSLDKNPEIQTACLRIAELIGSMTIYLMENTADGDKRIINELSRAVDIAPNGTMTRVQWMTAIVMNLLLYGKGNAVVLPHTRQGYLEALEPVAADRVSFMPLGTSRRDYRIILDGVARDPRDLLHFVYNPDPFYPWKGQGVTVTLKEIAQNLKQASKTENAFMTSEFRPPIVVKVTGMDERMADPDGRAEIVDEFLRPKAQGYPLLIPGEVFDVQQVKPLTLQDLAIKDTVELDKKTVASVIGVPGFLLARSVRDRGRTSFTSNTSPGITQGAPGMAGLT